MIEILIYTILTSLFIGVILYLIINLKTKIKNSNDKVPYTTHELHINYIEPKNKDITSSKPKQLKEPRDGKKDNLQLIKGIGKIIEKKLNDNGIYHFNQIANWTDENVQWINNNIIYFPKKIEREDWRGQAKILTKEKSSS
ncbi:NADH-ubiquinone oxidoreductase chain E [hydrothermal vent metagenome]|uniref:NADH-ubiquinone oxidoreductase chain E n=1 Tax=hydrothermal vent metagenome TaxID=652676 RepID=A0A1W1CL02_9ZZZZ